MAARRGVVGLVLLALAALLLLPVARGVDVTEVWVGVDGRLPARVYVPASAASGSNPGVVVAHGFAGSALLMHTWSLALAHAGFVVVAPDLPGHGANATPMRATQATGTSALADAIDEAIVHLLSLPEVDGDRIGLLGHSMGSGAVLEGGIAQVELVRAVVAVSPTDADVDGDAPRDLLLLAGANEGRFVANAESLLERAGGVRGEPGDGDARALTVVPVVEHVSILFARSAHDASIAWLAAALDHVPTGRAPMGPLSGWLLLVLGIVLTWQAIVAQASTGAAAPTRRRGAWVALAVGGVAATASLVIVARSIDIPTQVGVLVAGEVGLWFLLAGLVWLRFGVGLARPEVRDGGWAILATALLVLLGASATLAWLPWWLSGLRVSSAMVLTVLLLPFGLAAAASLHGRRGRAALGVWFVTSLSVLVTLGAAAIVVPGIGFLLLVLPLLPLVLAATTAVAVGLDRPWASGTASAVFIGWLLAMSFPLA
ncbi:MAG: alpha/beta fold hydrolase [Actinomycetota bacterium]|nr:alpha/beta fold hydrolase [Actinomycetota bacterium]